MANSRTFTTRETDMRREYIEHLKRFVDSKLGRCPFCMRASLYFSVVCWLTFAALVLYWPVTAAMGAALLLAVAFSLLALAHLTVFSGRVARGLCQRRAAS